MLPPIHTAARRDRLPGSACPHGGGRGRMLTPIAPQRSRCRAALAQLVLSILSALPEGRPLPDEIWLHRHRGILVLLWLHAIAIVGFGLITGASPVHAVAEAAVVAIAALLASRRRISRRLLAVIASVGLLTASAILVHLSGGYIELH